MIRQTQAMKITEETFPVVVACIPDQVDQTPEALEGCYLIINLLTNVQINDDGNLQPRMVNRIMAKEDFENEFAFTTGARANRFMHIRRICSPWDARRIRHEKERAERNKKYARRERRSNSSE